MSESVPIRPAANGSSQPRNRIGQFATAAPPTAVVTGSELDEHSARQSELALARFVEMSADLVRSSAGPATTNGIDRPRRGRKRDDVPSDDTNQPTPISESSGSGTGDTEQAGTRQTSKSLGGQSKASNKHWRTPRNAKEFAAQANEVTTMILNDEIDLNTARTFSGVARTMAQILTAEVYRARYLHREPNLSLEWDDDE